MTWTADCQGAFDQLKQDLVSANILAYADFAQPFKLCTNASFDGLGAILSQVQEGQERAMLMLVKVWWEQNAMSRTTALLGWSSLK